MRISLCLSLCLLLCASSGWAKKQTDYIPTILTPPPAAPQETQSVLQTPGGGASLSVDSFSSTQDHMQYEPYNTFPREIDLWNLEGKKFVRSDAVVSPNRHWFAYSEVIFLPSARQTISKLYLVAVPPLPAPQAPRLPSEEVNNPTPAVPFSVYSDRLDPTKHFKDRRMLSSIGFSKVVPYGFQTLTVVDWSESGQKLLYKQKTGVLHVGLRVSDIWVFDRDKGSATIYPAIHRVIKNYWKTRGNLPNMDELAWDIQPLGWEPNSDRAILLKAWAYDHEEKKFLGLWRYDLGADRTTLLSLTDDPIAVAANGWVAKPVPPPPPDSAKKKTKKS